MANYFKNIDDMPILALEEGINFNNPFVLIRIINESSKIRIKVMYTNIDINKVRENYYIYKNIVKEHLLIVNDCLDNINHNIDIHKAICEFYYDKINVVKLH